MENKRISGGYSLVWQYRVRPECSGEFERIYGADGDWVQLFRRAEGYVETLLLKQRASADSYVTVDRWRSEACYRAFHRDFAVQYAELDRQCESLTLDEQSLGEFDE